MNESDNWEKMYWQRRARQMQRSNAEPSNLPHYEPAHITQDRQRIKNLNNDWKDIDPVTAMYNNVGNRNSQARMVMVKPGSVYYKSVQTDGFGTTVPLVRNCGQYNEEHVREFELMSECKCYIIDNLQAVDLSDIDPGRMIELVQLKAPFVGVILVEKNSVVGSGKSGQQILKG